MATTLLPTQRLLQDAQTTLTNATLVIRMVRSFQWVLISQRLKMLLWWIVTAKFIYPLLSTPIPITVLWRPRVTFTGFNFNQPAQLTSNQKGAFGWNQAIRSDVEGAKLFNTDEAKAKTLRDIGFGTVLTHQKDGIARGTGVIVTLANEKENLVLLKEKASAHYSLNKGASTQSYPGSMMGVIALLRQSYIDASWYKGAPS